MTHTSGWRKRTTAQIEDRRLRCNRHGVPYYTPPSGPAPVIEAAITVTATTFPPLKLTRIKKWADPDEEDNLLTFTDSGDIYSGDSLPPPAPPPFCADNGFTGDYYTSNLSAEAPPYVPIPAQATQDNMSAPTVLPSIGKQLDCFLQNICDQISGHMAASAHPPAPDLQEIIDLTIRRVDNMEATLTALTARIDNICTKINIFIAKTEKNAADDNSGYDAITLSAKVDAIEAKLDVLTGYIMLHRCFTGNTALSNSCRRPSQAPTKRRW